MSGGLQSMTGGQGVEGAAFNQLFGVFGWVTGIAFAAVVLFLLAAIVRGGGAGEGGLRAAFGGWTLFVAIGLVVLAISSYLTDRHLAQAAAAPHPLRITITAKQWWWDVRYDDSDPSRTVHTANELHLPVGRSAIVRLASQDVIHSFWVPNLAGKQDMIPGRVTDIALMPHTSGRFRAQCAEFCGIQHAHMAMTVTVEPAARFNAWLDRQLASPAPPTTPLAKAGYEYFMGRQCASCHAVAGTPANANLGPDLSHFASRDSIAAGTYPMTRGHLYGWVADPQSAKPGNKMPVIGMEPNELHAVVAYLETLK